MGLKLPSVSKIVGFAVTMLVTLFILRFMPENVKGMFRI
jgi:hypothetical protein